jgi:hypothetical protein
LIGRFAEINEGDKLEIEYIKKGKAGFIEIKKVGAAKAEEGEMPTIQLDESDEDARPSLDGDKSIPHDDLPFD